MITYAVSKANYAELWGLSTDTKPTGVGRVPNGSLFTEIDTAKTYRFNGETGDWFDKTSKYPTKLEVVNESNTYKVTYSDTTTKTSDFEVVLDGNKATYTENGIKVSCDAIVATVTITVASETVAYDESEHTLAWNDSMSGYEMEADITSALFDASTDIVPLFDPLYSVSGTEVGEYPFGLSESSFKSTNTQIKVAFVVVDGSLEITEAVDENPEQ